MHTSCLAHAVNTQHGHVPGGQTPLDAIVGKLGPTKVQLAIHWEHARIEGVLTVERTQHELGNQNDGVVLLLEFRILLL